MTILSDLFGGGSSREPARLSLSRRNQSQSIRLAEYRKPWYNYWATGSGDQYYVVGGPKRKEEIFVPVVFPTRAIARAVAKYMTRASRIRVNGTRVR